MKRTPEEWLKKVKELLMEKFADKTKKFFTERDIVYSLQEDIRKDIKNNNLPYKVFNDCPILPGKAKRPLCADLVIISEDNFGELKKNPKNILKKICAEIAFEFKYEPDHGNKRKDDFQPKKFFSDSRVVSWNGVEKDRDRITDFVKKNKAKIGCSVFIDEGGVFQGKYSPEEHAPYIIYKCKMVSGKPMLEPF
ncbi:MAG: hypothetical protein WCI77_06840 [Candidatus Omnitrophota bacterium]